MAILEVTQLTKSFGDTKVLKGIDFSMERGEILSVIGSSGSGKTTLLRCLTSLETVDSGRIVVDGDLVFDGKTELSRSQKRKNQLKMGLVFQSFNLFPQYNVLKNVTLPRILAAKARPDWKTNKREILEQIDSEAKQLIDSVGLYEKLENYPSELSGGQQQRVAIARALAMHPDILCFDEPTSALDPELTGEVLNVIKELAARDMTMIIVTHEMRFAHDISDRILFMDNGVVAAAGTPDEVFGEQAPARVKSFIGAHKF